MKIITRQTRADNILGPQDCSHSVPPDVVTPEVE